MASFVVPQGAEQGPTSGLGPCPQTGLIHKNNKLTRLAAALLALCCILLLLLLLSPHLTLLPAALQTFPAAYFTYISRVVLVRTREITNAVHETKPASTPWKWQV